jgi:hypothetical protein
MDPNSYTVKRCREAYEQAPGARHASPAPDPVQAHKALAERLVGGFLTLTIGAVTALAFYRYEPAMIVVSVALVILGLAVLCGKERA